MKILLSIFACLFLSGNVFAQSMAQHDYLTFHNMLMQPDTMRFSFWKSGDTLMVHRILQQYVPTTDETIDAMLFNNKKHKNTVEGSRLFNGKHIQYRYGQEKYLVSGDTLYKFVITNKLSADSINTLFKRNEAGYYTKSDYLHNLEIIANNRTTVKKALFHPDFFKDDKLVTMNNSKPCPDTLRLLKKWQQKKTIFYRVQLTYNCGDYRNTASLIVDNNYQFYAFDKKYIDMRLSRHLHPSPFKSHFQLKSSIP